MSDSLPTVTVIIAARPDQTEIKAVPAVRALDYPPDKLDIIIARGQQPSVQRNTALRAARGELIYFLDDDSVAQPGNLRRAIEHFRDRQVQIVGGPNICPPEATPLEKVFALVLGSWLAFGPSRARYTPVGNVRETGEKELILCNQLARRETMLRHGGFNEALYPNEENALMDDIQQHGGKLLYDPGLLVYRRPRGTLKAFARMLRTYGRGRAEQFRVNPTFGSAPNFAPPLFLLYLIVLAVLWIIAFIAGQQRIAAWCSVPLVFYALLVLLQTVALVPRGGIARSLCALPWIALSHVLYGFGFWRGLFTRLKAPTGNAAPPVTLEIVAR